jgi:hypothetical protein
MAASKLVVAINPRENTKKKKLLVEKTTSQLKTFQPWISLSLKGDEQHLHYQENYKEVVQRADIATLPSSKLNNALKGRLSRKKTVSMTKKGELGTTEYLSTDGGDVHLHHHCKKTKWFFLWTRPLSSTTYSLAKLSDAI